MHVIVSLLLLFLFLFLFIFIFIFLPKGSGQTTELLPLLRPCGFHHKDNHPIGNREQAAP